MFYHPEDEIISKYGKHVDYVLEKAAAGDTFDTGVEQLRRIILIPASSMDELVKEMQQ